MMMSSWATVHSDARSIKLCVLAVFVSFVFLSYSDFQLTAATSFNFTRFNETIIKCTGNSSLSPQNQVLAGAICLAPATTTNTTPNIYGRCYYDNQIDFGPDFSFSTMFSFNTLRFQQYEEGEGFTFFIGPERNGTYGSIEGYLGLLNDTMENDTNNHYFAVEFDLVKQPQFKDPEYEHVGIDVASMTSVATAKPTFNITSFSSNERVYAWVEYDGGSNVVQVSLSQNPEKPCKTLLSTTLTKPLDQVVLGKSITGFSSSSGGKNQSNSQTTVWDWSFSTNGSATNIYSARNEKCGKTLSGMTLAVVIVISILCLALALAMILLFIYYRRAREFPQLKEENAALLQEKEQLVIKMKQVLREDDGAREFTYQELKQATSGFQHVIGRGGFGSVYEGDLPGIGKVAVKQINRTSENTEDVKQLVAEVQVLGRVKHNHIVPLKGWCYDQGRMLLVYKFMENSDLDAHLFPKKTEGAVILSWPKRMKILKGVAAALVFLHEEFESEEQVVHRDVKPTNVMLDNKFTPKLGDFGLARLFNRQGSLQDTGPIMGTPGYFPPEWQTGEATVEADVYSFGVLALVVATGIRPLDKKIPGKDLVKWIRDLHDQAIIVDATDPNLNNATKFSLSQRKEIEGVLTLGLRCCLYDPCERPTMRDVHTTLYSMSTMLSATLPRQFPAPVAYADVDLEDMTSDSDRRSTLTHLEPSDTDYLSSDPFSTTINFR